MTLKSLSVALATTALVSLALPAMAQDKTGNNVNTEAAATPAGGASTMGMAQELYAMGVASGDALTVLTAAKLAMSVEVKEGPAAKTDLDAETAAALGAHANVFSKNQPLASGVKRRLEAAAQSKEVSLVTTGTAPADDAEGAADKPVDATAMLAKAKELAADDEAMLGLIADAEAEGSRGRIGGAVSWLSRLPSGMQDVWEVPFYGNSYAEIAVVGDGDANLDVAVTDENGNVICYDVSYADKIYCDFTPSWDGYFYVTVENRGGSRNSYYLMTN